IRARQEQELEQAIAQANQALAAYQQELEPKLAELERQRVEKVARLDSELKEYEKTLLVRLPEWEKQQAPGSTEWIPLEPKSLKASREAKLTKQDDLSILAEVSQGPVVYTVTAETSLTVITGVRLEAIADD